MIQMMTAGCHGNAHLLLLHIDIDECAIGLEPCLAGQQCVNVAGSFHCQRPQRPGHDDQDDGGRQSDVAVDVGEDDRIRPQRVTRRPATSQTTTTTAPTTTTARRRHRPGAGGRLRCGTGFQYNHRTGRCEGIS